MTTKTQRDNFPGHVVETLKKRAAYICSNPTCKVMTVAPSAEDENKVQYIGVAAHITAASEEGPRYDEKLTEEERKAISNAIFLCGSCSTMIDKNDGIDYKTKTLSKWKTDHEKWVLNNLNKSFKSQISFNSSSENQSGGITANVINFYGLQHNGVDEKKEHDKKMFIAINEIFKEEDLKKILDSMLGDESIWSADQDKLESLKIHLEKSSHDFLDEKIETIKKKLSDSLVELLKFLSREFDMYPYKQPTLDRFRACLRPTLNVERLGTGGEDEEREHRELYRKLEIVSEKFENNYKVFRKMIKGNLHI